MNKRNANLLILFLIPLLLLTGCKKGFLYLEQEEILLFAEEHDVITCFAAPGKARNGYRTAERKVDVFYDYYDNKGRWRGNIYPIKETEKYKVVNYDKTYDLYLLSGIDATKDLKVAGTFNTKRRNVTKLLKIARDVNQLCDRIEICLKRDQGGRRRGCSEVQ